MGVYIKDTKMPKHCGECGIEWCERWKKLIVAGMSVTKSRAPDCPLIEIPTPRGDLIDRYALLKSMEMNGNPKTVSDHINNIVRFLDTLMDAPAVILAEPPKEET